LNRFRRTLLAMAAAAMLVVSPVTGVFAQEEPEMMIVENEDSAALLEALGIEDATVAVTSDGDVVIVDESGNSLVITADGEATVVTAEGDVVDVTAELEAELSGE
jgi:sulfur carrier protein ThiS